MKGISFIISTNGKKPISTHALVISIHKTMSKVELDYEVIIVGSVSPLGDLYNTFLIPKSYLANTGKLPALRNIGGKHSKYDTLVFCDDDLLFPDEWSKNFLRYDKNNNWDVLGNRILLPDGSRYWDRAIISPTHELFPYDFKTPPGEVYQTGCFWIIKAKIFHKHPWDENIEYYAEKKGGINEDVEYSKRLQNEKYTLSFDKNNLIYHNDNQYVEFKNRVWERNLLSDHFPFWEIEKEIPTEYQLPVNSKNLVFTSAGDNHNFHKLWIDQHRDFDIAVAFYGDNDKKFEEYKKEVDYIEKSKGDKWQNFWKFWYERDRWETDLTNYERFFILDGDIEFSCDDINEMFKISKEYNLDICAPSFTPGVSRISWPITKHQPNSILRYTNWVENNTPLLTYEALYQFMKVYDPNRINPWGTDYLMIWVNGVDKRDKYAIIDKVQCINPNPNIVHNDPNRDIMGVNTDEVQKQKWFKFRDELEIKEWGKYNYTEGKLDLIPKIIHQTWKDKNVPPKTQFCIDSWKKSNPEWEYKFWTDEDIDKFIAKYYPEHEDRVKNFQKGIIKADFFRLLVLYHFGGIYVDIDFECLKPIKEWEFDCEKINIGCEPKEHNLVHGKENGIVCNALIMSPKNHPIPLLIIERGNGVNNKHPLEVMNSYGPLSWTRMFENIKKNKNFPNILQPNILKSELIYPLPDVTNPNLNYTDVNRKEYMNKIKNKDFNSYAVHYWDHSNVSRPSILDFITK